MFNSSGNTHAYTYMHIRRHMSVAKGYGECHEDMYGKSCCASLLPAPHVDTRANCFNVGMHCFSWMAPRKCLAEFHRKVLDATHIPAGRD